MNDGAKVRKVLLLRCNMLVKNAKNPILRALWGVSWYHPYCYAITENKSIVGQINAIIDVIIGGCKRLGHQSPFLAVFNAPMVTNLSLFQHPFSMLSTGAEMLGKRTPLSGICLYISKQRKTFLSVHKENGTKRNKWNKCTNYDNMREPFLSYCLQQPTAMQYAIGMSSCIAALRL